MNFCLISSLVFIIPSNKFIIIKIPAMPWCYMPLRPLPPKFLSLVYLGYVALESRNPKIEHWLNKEKVLSQGHVHTTNTAGHSDY